MFLEALHGERTANGRSVWEGVYTEGQAKRGEVLYARECAACHADTLTGLEAAPALAGDRFWASWQNLTVADFFERTRITMPPTNPAGLSRQEYADILAFILQSNRFPAGATELAPGTAAQRLIRIDARARTPPP